MDADKIDWIMRVCMACADLPTHEKLEVFQLAWPWAGNARNGGTHRTRWLSDRAGAPSGGLTCGG